MFVKLVRIVSMIVAMGVAGGRPAAAQAADVRLPPNIHVAGELQPVIGEMLAASSTFRRQWAALTRPGRLHVSVFVTRSSLGADRRAETVMRRYSSGLLFAVVLIPGGGAHVELIAHEFEHIVEQIEGVNLPALARSGSPAVRQGHDGSFETARAQHAGRTVSAEVRLAGRPD